jgi:lipid II isoglutaminyl synthase (glutamine-hydrolysing)
METQTLRICHLYPSILSVAGDRGNLIAIQRRTAWRGMQIEVTDISLGQTPDFSAFDIILFHGGQDVEMNIVAGDLADKAASLRDAIESDVVVLAVCAGYQLLGHYYQPSKGPRLDGIGAIDMRTEGEQVRFMNHIAITCNFAPGGEQTLVGFENHSGRTYLGPKAQPLGHVLAGAGNNGKDGGEGARYRQVYASYLHGPVLPKNPWFADHLIYQGLRHRYGDVAPLTPLDDDVEQHAHEAALKLARRFKNKTTALEATNWHR